MLPALLPKQNELYGELLYESAVRLIQSLQLTAQDHLLDIGSGFGKFVLQAALLSDVGSALGIELNELRHRIAEQFREELFKSLLESSSADRLLKERDADRIRFYAGDFTTGELDPVSEGFLLQRVTVVYICATVFSEALILAIGRRLNQFRALKKVFSLRKIPNLMQVALKKRFFLEGTWDRTPCYYYEKVC